jgi:NAD(P)H-flavin reductase
VDSQNKVFKEPFFAVSSPSSQGYFDIIVRRDRDTNSADKFTKALDTLALGDEIAFKVGRNRLNYIGIDDVIEHISIVASGMGIVPAIQILRGILPAFDSTVETVDLLWINEDKIDFFCNREIEKLEYRYFERFSVTRILETDLYGRDLSKVSEVTKQFSKFESGKIGIICGPDYVINKMRSLFYDMEYPTVNILSIQSVA